MAFSSGPAGTTLRGLGVCLGWLLFEIGDGPLHHIGSVSEQPDASVALRAEQPAHFGRLMTVVYDQLSSTQPADVASTSRDCDKLLELSDTHAVSLRTLMHPKTGRRTEQGVKPDALWQRGVTDGAVEQSPLCT